MSTLQDYSGQKPAWCPGCGNFSILKAFNEAMAELGLNPHEFVIVSGIGQAGKFPHYTRCNTFNGLHGRTLPVATGIKLANHKLKVFAVAGDGDCYGEGGNHLIHAIRRNIDVKLFIHNNQIYGLTKGQASPTSMKGMITKTQPFGVFSEQFNPLAMAVALNCSFVARGFAGDMEHLKALIKEAVTHRGFSLIDILQPCVSFNKINTFEWYRQRVYRLSENYDPFDRAKAFEKSLEWGDSIPIGVVYKTSRPVFEEQIPVIKEKPLVEQKLAFEKIKSLIGKFY
ncbi:2-oxoacid:ferredoxin oxidoreductase subunit beta [Thermodesulfovibrio yellowstonii]|uniref:2-oxoacid:ferredoxin oxidoreductase subunit beta n=1 Tax=Thermodesulfovibrio yellowstonii (strain ATCC 51303 / DSM 11347 / YP87) TaxID=289376 RepID=B5YKQ0_THEYD|nr:2-oxoacid:ferredoxin oxidoreductase subunit beta [Thermodesulfovibrio yellowstonii]ACI21248.1 2-oxoacid:ferredoxin oxidoreductase subunit beta [Thermodesulfovibrio yellowstonii DSM 11347]